VTPGLSLALQQPDSRHRELLSRHRVAGWIRAALDAPAEITVRIVGEDEGRRLNREFRGKDYATNVLTFDYARKPAVHADLVLCAPVVEREAAALGLPVADHYAHLLVHGTLHAQGWDHERGEADAAAMEARERAILRALGLHDPYPDRGPLLNAVPATAPRRSPRPSAPPPRRPASAAPRPARSRR
jgi:probable rRNA maturation factor